MLLVTASQLSHTQKKLPKSVCSMFVRWSFPLNAFPDFQLFGISLGIAIVAILATTVLETNYTSSVLQPFAEVIFHAMCPDGFAAAFAVPWTSDPLGWSFRKEESTHSTSSSWWAQLLSIAQLRKLASKNMEAVETWWSSLGTRWFLNGKIKSLSEGCKMWWVLIHYTKQVFSPFPILVVVSCTATLGDSSPNMEQLRARLGCLPQDGRATFTSCSCYNRPCVRHSSGRYPGVDYFIFRRSGFRKWKQNKEKVWCPGISVDVL